MAKLNTFAVIQPDRLKHKENGVLCGNVNAINKNTMIINNDDDDDIFDEYTERKIKDIVKVEKPLCLSISKSINSFAAFKNLVYEGLDASIEDTNKHFIRKTKERYSVDKFIESKNEDVSIAKEELHIVDDQMDLQLHSEYVKEEGALDISCENYESSIVDDTDKNLLDGIRKQGEQVYLIDETHENSIPIHIKHVEVEDHKDHKNKSRRDKNLYVEDITNKFHGKHGVNDIKFDTSCKGEIICISDDEDYFPTVIKKIAIGTTYATSPDSYLGSNKGEDQRDIADIVVKCIEEDDVTIINRFDSNKINNAGLIDLTALVEESHEHTKDIKDDTYHKCRKENDNNSDMHNNNIDQEEVDDIFTEEQGKIKTEIVYNRKYKTTEIKPDKDIINNTCKIIDTSKTNNTIQHDKEIDESPYKRQKNNISNKNTLGNDKQTTDSKFIIMPQESRSVINHLCESKIQNLDKSNLGITQEIVTKNNVVLNTIDEVKKRGKDTHAISENKLKDRNSFKKTISTRKFKPKKGCSCCKEPNLLQCSDNERNNLYTPIVVANNQFEKFFEEVLKRNNSVVDLQAENTRDQGISDLNQTNISTENNTGKICSESENSNQTDDKPLDKEICTATDRSANIHKGHTLDSENNLLFNKNEYTPFKSPQFLLNEGNEDKKIDGQLRTYCNNHRTFKKNGVHNSIQQTALLKFQKQGEVKTKQRIYKERYTCLENKNNLKVKDRSGCLNSDATKCKKQVLQQLADTQDTNENIESNHLQNNGTKSFPKTYSKDLYPNRTNNSIGMKETVCFKTGKRLSNRDNFRGVQLDRNEKSLFPNLIGGSTLQIEENVLRKDKCSSIDVMYPEKQSELENNELHSCKMCPNRCHSKMSITYHINIHSKTVISCKLCNYVTNFKENLIAHMKVHLEPDEEDVFKCTHCSYKAKRKHVLEEHLFLHNISKDLEMFSCEHCPFRSKSKSSLEKHKCQHKSRNGSVLFGCEWCSHAALTKGDLKVHMLVHRKKNKFQL